MIDRDYLKEKILDIHDDVKKLDLLRIEMDDKYRIPALQFWKIVSEAMQEAAQKVKAFVGDTPLSPTESYVNRLVMDQLLETFDHSEKQIVIHSVSSIKN